MEEEESGLSKGFSMEKTESVTQSIRREPSGILKLIVYS